MSDPVMSLELRISKLLRYGVFVAGGLMLIGWISFLDFSHNPLAAFHEYSKNPLMQSLSLAWAQQQWGLLTAYAGLIALIALPLLRVLLTGILFVWQKERVLASIAFFVFVTLLISFSLGIEL